jgi:hypothetical protein
MCVSSCFQLTVNGNNYHRPYTTSPCPSELDLSHCAALGKPELAHTSFISITILTPGRMTRYSNMKKVHEPYSKDLSDRLCADNIVNEFNSDELLFAKDVGKERYYP